MRHLPLHHVWLCAEVSARFIDTGASFGVCSDLSHRGDPGHPSAPQARQHRTPPLRPFGHAAPWVSTMYRKVSVEVVTTTDRLRFAAHSGER